jgi:hypothetical protein
MLMGEYEKMGCVGIKNSIKVRPATDQQKR